MDRCVVLVDAGYLMGAAATLLAYNGLRNSVTADYGPMLASIVQEAQEQTGLPVLRVMWYDAAPEARPTQTHLTLVSLPDVKVRLGVLVRHGTRTEQKGVDSFLQRDLTTLARNGAVADIVLIGGDEDLRRGVVEAQDYGVKVHLWGVWAAAPRYNQAPTLIAEADRRFVLSEEWVRSYIRLRPGVLSADDPALAAGLAGTPRIPNQISTVALSPRPNPIRDLNQEGTPSADDLAPDPAGQGASCPAEDPPQASLEPVTPAIMRHFSPPHLAAGSVSAGLGGAGVLASGHSMVRTQPAPGDPADAAATAATATDAIPTLADLTTQPQVWRDNEEDTTAVLADPDAVGERYGRRWVARASTSHRRALLSLYPKLPRGMDGEVLRFAFTRGIDTWEDESAKFAIRAAVWRAIGANGSAANAAQHTAPSEPE